MKRPRDEVTRIVVAAGQAALVAEREGVAHRVVPSMRRGQWRRAARCSKTKSWSGRWYGIAMAGSVEWKIVSAPTANPSYLCLLCFCWVVGGAGMWKPGVLYSLHSAIVDVRTAEVN
jgi:hypothetical protein